MAADKGVEDGCPGLWPAGILRSRSGEGRGSLLLHSAVKGRKMGEEERLSKVADASRFSSNAHSRKLLNHLNYWVFRF